MDSVVLNTWTAVHLPSHIKLRHSKRVAIENLLFRKLLIFSPMLSSFEYVVGVKATVRCKCFKANAECTLHCHGQDGGAQCINTGLSAAPSGTFNLERNTRSAPPEPSHNLKRRRARRAALGKRERSQNRSRGLDVVDRWIALRRWPSGSLSSV
jgi:hypothetical protein